MTNWTKKFNKVVAQINTARGFILAPSEWLEYANCSMNVAVAMYECDMKVCCVGCDEVVCNFDEEPPHKNNRDEAVCSECSIFL